VRILVNMTCSAGIFQIQNVLGGKVRSSGLKDQVEVVGVVNARDKDQMFDKIEL
jgi:metal-dependent HD superfamily phosphatase/phosphodiesterase